MVAQAPDVTRRRLVESDLPPDYAREPRTSRMNWIARESCMPPLRARLRASDG